MKFIKTYSIDYEAAILSVNLYIETASFTKGTPVWRKCKYFEVSHEIRQS
jgi:hypothetical protein